MYISQQREIEGYEARRHIKAVTIGVVGLTVISSAIFELEWREATLLFVVTWLISYPLSAAYIEPISEASPWSLRTRFLVLSASTLFVFVVRVPRLVSVVALLILLVKWLRLVREFVLIARDREDVHEIDDQGAAAKAAKEPVEKLKNDIRVL